MIGLAISLGCLWLAFRNVQFASLEQSLQGGHYAWLLPAVGLQLLGVIARAQRWVVLLGCEGRLVDAFWAQGVGYLFTNIFPLRLGEPARMIIMSERCKIPFMRVAGSAVLERLLDVATVLIALLLVLPWMKVPGLVTNAGLIFGSLLLIALVILFTVMHFSRSTERLLKFLGKHFTFLPAETLIAYWQELVDGLAPLSRWQICVPAACWSAITWSLTIGIYWCVLHAFEPNGVLIEAVFMVVALSLAVAVPSSPGFIGVFQFVGEQALVLPFGGKYTLATALAITVAAYLIYYVITTALGIIGLLQSRHSVMNLGRAALSRQPVSTDCESG